MSKAIPGISVRFRTRISAVKRGEPASFPERNCLFPAAACGPHPMSCLEADFATCLRGGRESQPKAALDAAQGISLIRGHKAQGVRASRLELVRLLGIIFPAPRHLCSTSAHPGAEHLKSGLCTQGTTGAMR